MLDFISVIDLTSGKNDGIYRTVSLGMSDKHPNSLCLLGILAHNTMIGFDKKNAQKLIKFLEKIE